MTWTDFLIGLGLPRFPVSCDAPLSLTKENVPGSFIAPLVPEPFRPQLWGFFFPEGDVGQKIGIGEREQEMLIGWLDPSAS